jgi:hypothetical protein
VPQQARANAERARGILKAAARCGSRVSCMPIAHDSRARHACQSRTCCASISFWIVFFGFFLKSTSREVPPACATIAYAAPPSRLAAEPARVPRPSAAASLPLLRHPVLVLDASRRRHAPSDFETFDQHSIILYITFVQDIGVRRSVRTPMVTGGTLKIVKKNQTNETVHESL